MIHFLSSMKDITGLDGAHQRLAGSLLSHVEEINQSEGEGVVAERAKNEKVHYVNLTSFPISKEAIDLITKKAAFGYQAVPFYMKGKVVHVATLDTTHNGVKELCIALTKMGLKPEVTLVSKASMAYILHLYTEDAAMKSTTLNLDMKETEAGTFDEELVSVKGHAGKIQKMSEQEVYEYMLKTAVLFKASDIHIQPSMGEAIVRYRVDGDLHTAFVLTAHVYQHVLTRLKFLCDLKLNITDIPQDGKFSFTVSGRRIDIRLSLLPTEYGESVVMRLLDSNKTSKGIEDLGFAPYTLSDFAEVMAKPEGMMIVTGPTGSGKTTTLYAALAKLNTENKKVITLEDPIEYHLQGIAQSQINDSKGYTFAGGLRSILRQDPDIIMLGEIRDEETAKTAIQAALTGHMVLSTVHANSAVETIPRMKYMGVLPYLLAPALSLLVAQRLVRSLCPHCTKGRAIKPTEKALLESAFQRISAHQSMKSSTWTFPKHIAEAIGCEQCSHTGYLGRCGILETLVVTDAIKGAIYDSKTSKEVLDIALSGGMITMKENGLHKVMLCQTTLEEVLRVAG